MEHESEVIRLLESRGPQTGAELQEATRAEIRQLWTMCQQSHEVEFHVVGRRYLRLDRTIEGYARLSPSIRREFQTYTVLGLASQAAAASERALGLRQGFRAVSRAKAELAETAVREALADVADRDAILEQSCCILAGDITYDMAHAVPRPEASTGELVRGSDLDIVVVTEDDFPPERLRVLDNAIYQRKHFLLVHPEYREEIDYLIKDLTKVRQQLGFDAFEYMVACKILHEGVFLYGSRRLFDQVKALLVERGIAARLEAMERRAIEARARAETTLLDPPADLPDREVLTLFYTKEESEEIF